MENISRTDLRSPGFVRGNICPTYKRFFSFILVASFLSLSCNAQKENRLPDKVNSHFFEDYQTLGLEKAMDNVFQYSDVKLQKSLPYIKDTLNKTIATIGGTYCGAELLFKKQISNSLFFASYVVKYRIAPLRFNFIFYKALNDWQIVNFAFDGNIIDEMNEMGRVYFLK